MTFLLFDVGRYMPVDAPDWHAQVSGASSSDCDSDSQFDRVEDMLESLDLGGCLSDFESPSHSDSSDGQGDDNDTSVPGAFPHPGYCLLPARYILVVRVPSSTAESKIGLILIIYYLETTTPVPLVVLGQMTLSPVIATQSPSTGNRTSMIYSSQNGQTTIGIF
jgi:hypothetical protein